MGFFVVIELTSVAAGILSGRGVCVCVTLNITVD